MIGITAEIFAETSAMTGSAVQVLTTMITVGVGAGSTWTAIASSSAFAGAVGSFRLVVSPLTAPRLRLIAGNTISIVGKEI